MDRITQLAQQAILPALAWLPRQMDTGVARVLMVAIALQESQILWRRQLGNGPARGFWQFELGVNKPGGGGVWGVWHHKASGQLLRDACAWRGVVAQPKEIWAALESDDVLAATVARLLMWTDAQALPRDSASAWLFYCKRTWCPGKPKPGTWPANWRAAVDYGVRQGWVTVNGKGEIQ